MSGTYEVKLTRRPPGSDGRPILQSEWEQQQARIAELEAIIARIADEVVDPDMAISDMRRAISNIRYIINPAT